MGSQGPKEEKDLGLKEEIKGLKFSRRRKGQILFFFSSTFLGLSHKTIFFFKPVNGDSPTDKSV